VLRRDGFARWARRQGTLPGDAAGDIRGKHLFVNVAAEGGELRAEVLDRDSQVITG